MTIDLVTGATGLLGANLARALLARGRRVRVLARPSSNTHYLDDLPGLERALGDITDPASLPAAFQGVEHVYHCAALVSLWRSRAEQIHRVNVGGTANVVRAARRAGVQRLIHCSSVDALGLAETEPATEATPWNWDRLGLENPYARTKHLAQQLVLQAAATDLDAVVVNPTFMLGAFDARPSSGRVILEIASGKAWGYPLGGNNFVDVQDVAEAMIAAAWRGQRGRCYILGHENLSYREIFGRIAQVLRLSPPRFAIPYPLARLGGWLGDFYGWLTRQEPGVNSATARLGYVNHYYSSARAVRELGLRQTPIEQAIQRAVRWFYDAGMLPRYLAHKGFLRQAQDRQPDPALIRSLQC
jgi:dihydroflavonol-4-reductase